MKDGRQAAVLRTEFEDGLGLFFPSGTTSPSLMSTFYSPEPCTVSHVEEGVCW